MIDLTENRFIYAVEWYTPYTDPPSGPRIIAWGQSRQPGHDYEVRDAVWKVNVPKYVAKVYMGLKKPTLIPPARLARMRRALKETQARKKCPLFADQESRRKTLLRLDAEFIAMFPKDREVKINGKDKGINR